MRRLLVLYGIMVGVISLSMNDMASAGYTIKPAIGKIVGTGQIRAGKTNVKSVNFFSTAAGDNISVYDADIAAGPVVVAELKFEVGISANNSSQPGPDMGVDGADFSQGFYVVSNNAAGLTSIVYDY